MRYVLLLLFGTAVTALGVFQLRRDLEVPRRSQWSGEPPDGIYRFRIALTIAIGAVFAALSLVALVARTVF